jgi:hypothetical protein
MNYVRNKDTNRTVIQKISRHLGPNRTPSCVINRIIHSDASKTTYLLTANDAVTNFVVSNMFSSVHHVLCTPELSLMIFSLLSDPDLARLSATCSWLGGMALDVLWRKCSNPRALFQILSPLNENTLVTFVSKLIASENPPVTQNIIKDPQRSLRHQHPAV